MIGAARLYRCLGLLPRVWYATEIRCRYTNQTPKPAPDHTLDPAEREASDHDTGVVPLRARLMAGDQRPRQRASWVKSP